jgi:CRISPR-associated protein Csd1
MIHERPAVRAFWESLYENNLDLMGKPQTCTVCGQLRRPVRLHQKVQGLGQDTPLVSADKPAYLSYGFEGGCDTAPFCYRCMVGYVTALNYLINGHSFPLGKKTIVAHWSQYPIPKNILANLGFIDPDTDTETNKENNGEPQKSQDPAKIIDGLLEGNEPRLDLDHVHTLALTAQSKRITIQGYLDITVREFYERVRQFFHDSEVPRKLSGNYEDYSYTGINSIVNSLLPPGRNKDLPTRAVELLHAILEGKPFPAWVLYALLDRYQSDRIFSRPRLAILRAVLVRLHRQRGNEEIVTVSLNREFPSAAYHLGRLLAVAHRQQYFAIGNQ